MHDTILNIAFQIDHNSVNTVYLLLCYDVWWSLEHSRTQTFELIFCSSLRWCLSLDRCSHSLNLQRLLSYGLFVLIKRYCSYLNQFLRCCSELFFLWRIDISFSRLRILANLDTSLNLFLYFLEVTHKLWRLWRYLAIFLLSILAHYRQINSCFHCEIQEFI